MTTCTRNRTAGRKPVVTNLERKAVGTTGSSRDDNDSAVCMSGQWIRNRRANIEKVIQERPDHGAVRQICDETSRSKQDKMRERSATRFRSWNPFGLAPVSWKDRREPAGRGRHLRRPIGARKSLPFHQEDWSGRRDSNPGPPEPHSGTLPDCATSRPEGAFEQARRAMSNARVVAASSESAVRVLVPGTPGTCRRGTGPLSGSGPLQKARDLLELLDHALALGKPRWRLNRRRGGLRRGGRTRALGEEEGRDSSPPRPRSSRTSSDVPGARWRALRRNALRRFPTRAVSSRPRP